MNQRETTEVKIQATEEQFDKIVSLIADEACPGMYGYGDHLFSASCGRNSPDNRHCKDCWRKVLRPVFIRKIEQPTRKKED
jgi:hypothetical protein